jgi:signal transduction histidine kinase
MFEAKEIIYNLRPIQLDRFGLTKAIQAMLKKISDTNSIEFTTQVEPIDGLLTKEAESSLYRILQESVNNIVRHSEATKAEVVIKRKDGFITTIIKDNGKGFIVGAMSQNENHKGGFGLVGIIERARLLKGEADITSTLQNGTVVTITLPLKKDLSESQTK